MICQPREVERLGRRSLGIRAGAVRRMPNKDDGKDDILSPM